MPEFCKRDCQKENCYKMMLLTGFKKESTLDFYRKTGYNSEDKTIFIQWISSSAGQIITQNTII